MPSYFRDALTPLAELGVIEILEFLLVLVIVFVFLKKTNILGNRSRLNANIIVSLCSALIFVNLIPGSIFVSYFSWAIVFFVAAICLILLLSFLNVEKESSKYAIIGFFVIAIALIVSQFIKSIAIMKFVLALGVLSLIATGLMGKRFPFLGAIGANIILIVMATSLEMGRAISDVYLNGVSIALIAFAILIWWMLGESESGSSTEDGDTEEKKKGKESKEERSRGEGKEEKKSGDGKKEGAKDSGKDGKKGKEESKKLESVEDISLPRRKTYSKIGEPYRRIKKEEIEEEEPGDTMYGGEEY